MATIITAQESDNTEVSKKVLNVVIFGNSGTGKSSVCNLIFDREACKATGGPMGCTLTHECVSDSPSGYPNIYLNLYDTTGLDEGSTGAVPSKEAFIQLVKLLYSIEGGINLLICCAQMKSRLSIQSFKTNYKAFVDSLCEKKVPCILVLTGYDLEDDAEKPMDAYWNDNKTMILKTFKFNFKFGTSVTTKKTIKNVCGKKQLEDYQLSRMTLIEAINTYASDRPWKMDSTARQISVWFRRMWNKIVSHLPWFQTQLRPDLIQMFEHDLNMSHDEAVVEANKLCTAIHDKDCIKDEIGEHFNAEESNEN